MFVHKNLSGEIFNPLRKIPIEMTEFQPWKFTRHQWMWLQILCITEKLITW